MLADLQLRNFRCFETLGAEFSPGFNFILGRNGQGKTSILEAACALVRLQSQRSATLAPLIRFGQKSFAVAGHTQNHFLEFRYAPLRRKISFDEIEQRTAEEYLRTARVVSLANTDIELLRGGGEMRRRYLDFLGTQIDSRYRPTLRAYDRALRSRNALLKSSHPRPQEIAAYDRPLLEHGAQLSDIRARLIERLTPFAVEAHREVSGMEELLALKFVPGNSADFARDLVDSRAQEQRLRQTIVGPHRDDLQILIAGRPAAQYASEGQQRTAALALKISQARVFLAEDSTALLLLIDDIFGELDPMRRNSLLRNLPPEAQKLVTATAMSWRDDAMEGTQFELRDGVLFRT
ncbi:MAG: DNA replication and repair protein RecF [Verrucomicrobiota bacterium]